jgi:hypothetical protein
MLRDRQRFLFEAISELDGSFCGANSRAACDARWRGGRRRKDSAKQV